MSDPYGWDAQNRQSQANQQAAARRHEQDMAAGHAVTRGQAGTAPPDPGRSQPPPSQPAGYWAALAHCPTHDRWGCSFGKARQLAIDEATSAACGPASGCRKELFGGLSGIVFPGYLMVRRDYDGKLRWGSGRSRRSAARKLRRQIGADSELVLLVSIRDGVVVNEGLNITCA